MGKKEMIFFIITLPEKLCTLELYLGFKSKKKKGKTPEVIKFNIANY
jgi:hypothetical protein